MMHVGRPTADPRIHWAAICLYRILRWLMILETRKDSIIGLIDHGRKDKGWW